MKLKYSFMKITVSAFLVASLVLGICFYSSGFASVPIASAAALSLDQVSEALSGLSVPFIENQGQVGDADQFQYYAQTIAGTVFVGPDGLTYALPQSSIKEHFVSNAKLDPKGTDRAVTKISYFKGSQDSWKSDLPSFNSLNGGQLWPGITMSLQASNRNIEKIFTVAPGADPSDIGMDVEGATLSIAKTGQLIFHTASGDLSMTKPVAYQDIDGQRHDISVSYSIKNQTYGFILGTYDHNHPLTIDPLIASTFVGGTGFENGGGMAFDSSGNVYVVGIITDGTAPLVAGAYDDSYNGGGQDGYVIKINASLTSLLSATYIGGTSTDSAPAIA